MLLLSGAPCSATERVPCSATERARQNALTARRDLSRFCQQVMRRRYFQGSVYAVFNLQRVSPEA